MHSLVEPGSQAEQVGRLVLAGVVVVALPSLPFGTYLVYPFTILTTWFHEMGHGLTALLLGQHFEQLAIYANGSGVAESFVDTDASVFTHAGIAAGGPLGPTFAGAAMIVASAHRRIWRGALWALAGAILLSALVYVRSTVGLTVLPLTGAAIALVAWRARDGAARFLLQFLGVLAAMSMVSDLGYLFTERAVIDGTVMLSDTGQIEAALMLPHWVWAIALLVFSAAIILAALRYALDPRRLRPQPRRPANVLQFRRDPPR